jgi:hypothetical protein
MLALAACTKEQNDSAPTPMPTSEQSGTPTPSPSWKATCESLGAQALGKNTYYFEAHLLVAHVKPPKVSFDFGDGSLPQPAKDIRDDDTRDDPSYIIASTDYTYNTPKETTTYTVGAAMDVGIAGKTMSISSPGCKTTIDVVAP